MGKGARVVVRQPKIELAALRKQRPAAARRPSPPPEPPRVEFNLMTMYENRNQQLSEELTRSIMGLLWLILDTQFIGAFIYDIRSRGGSWKRRPSKGGFVNFIISSKCNQRKLDKTPG